MSDSTFNQTLHRINVNVNTQDYKKLKKVCSETGMTYSDVFRLCFKSAIR